MRGISPILAVVLLIAISVIASVGVWYWVNTTITKKPTPNPVSPITVTPVGKNKILIANLGLKSLNTNEVTTAEGVNITCEDPVINPGEQTLCVIENTTSGEITIYMPGSGSSTITVNTGDIDNPKISELYDTWNHTLVGEEIMVHAKIEDNVGVENATLYFRKSGGEWNQMSMTRISGNNSSGTWSAGFIPDSVGNWEYYVMAWDHSGNNATSKTIVRYISVVRFAGSTPQNNSNTGSSFSIDLELSGTPEKIILDFNGTNFTIYGGDELYYIKFDDTGTTVKDVWNHTWGSRDKIMYIRSLLGVVPISTTDPLDGWYGENLERGDFDWCGGTGGRIYYAKSTVTSPTAGSVYSLKYDGPEVWNLTNATNIYFDIKLNQSSSNFDYIGVCLIDTNGKTACHQDTGTFSAGTVRHEWLGLYTSSIKSSTFFSPEESFDWSNVTAFELLVKPNTNNPFTMQIAPVRYAFPHDSRTTGNWGKAINTTLGKQTNIQQNWCATGSVVLLNPGRDRANESFTVSVWFKSNDPDPSAHYEYGIISLWGDRYWCDGFDIIKRGSNLEYRVGYDPCTKNHYSNNTYIDTDWNNAGDGNWHMITLSASGENLMAYLDGNLINETTMPDTIYSHADMGFVGGVGASLEWCGPPSFGYLGEYHLYNYTLTPDQIKLLYHLEYGPYYAKLHSLSPGKYWFKVYAETTNGTSWTETRFVDVS